LDIINGLPYIKSRPPTDKEFDTLPHVVTTSDIDWDPSTLDNVINIDSEDWYPEDELCAPYGKHQFSETGTYMKNSVQKLHQLSKYNSNPIATQIIDDIIDSFIDLKFNYTVTTTKEPDYALFRSRFGYLSDKIIKKAFLTTTQYT
jgi:hypothetical protein